MRGKSGRERYNPSGAIWPFFVSFHAARNSASSPSRARRSRSSLSAIPGRGGRDGGGRVSRTSARLGWRGASTSAEAALRVSRLQAPRLTVAVELGDVWGDNADDRCALGDLVHERACAAGTSSRSARARPRSRRVAPFSFHGRHSAGKDDPRGLPTKVERVGLPDGHAHAAAPRLELECAGQAQHGPAVRVGHEPRAIELEAMQVDRLSGGERLAGMRTKRR